MKWNHMANLKPVAYVAGEKRKEKIELTPE